MTSLDLLVFFVKFDYYYGIKLTKYIVYERDFQNICSFPHIETLSRHSLKLFEKAIGRNQDSSEYTLEFRSVPLSNFLGCLLVFFII